MKLLQYFLFLCLVLSCKKDDPENIGPCGLVNPLQNLEWLRKDVERLSQSPDVGYACFSAIYKNDRVFWFYSFSTAGDLMYRTCDGQRHFLDQTETDAETKKFLQSLTIPRKSCEYLIWSTPAYDAYKTCP